MQKRKLQNIAKTLSAILVLGMGMDSSPVNAAKATRCQAWTSKGSCELSMAPPCPRTGAVVKCKWMGGMCTQVCPSTKKHTHKKKKHTQY
jgi:hypothetical protein